MIETLLIVALIGVIGLSVLGIRMAYCNGVTDGFGYSQEPDCPGYKAAGDHLRATMAHRWPCLNDYQKVRYVYRGEMEPRKVDGE